MWKRTTMVVPRFTRMSGPGYWLLKAYMMTVLPRRVRRTRPAVRSRVSPSDMRIVWLGSASGSVDGSTPSPGSQGCTEGLSFARPSRMFMPACMGGMRPMTSAVSPATSCAFGAAC